MNNPKISIIAAIGKHRELGKDNKLLWHIPEDIKRFKQLTTEHVVIMGRNTYESIGKPLHNRTNIIITHDKNYHAENCMISHSLHEALILAKEKEIQEIFIIGGGQIYQQALTLTDKLYLTIVDASKDADVFFPEYQTLFTKIIYSHTYATNKYTYSFIDLERR